MSPMSQSPENEPRPPTPASPPEPPGGSPGAVEPPPAEVPTSGPGPLDRAPCLSGPGRRRKPRLAAPDEPERASVTPEQRLLILDTWQRSGLPAADFAAMIGLSKHTLYSWQKRFENHGPGGLVDHARGCKGGSRLPDITKRAILMLKKGNPDYGCQRISDMLARGPALPASASAVARVLHEAGYKLEEAPTAPHAAPAHRFERAKPNQLWQSDLFTFMLKRQNRRVYLVAFLDDHSRFLVSYGLHATQSALLVLEVLRAGLASFGAPEEVLTDNGSQYVTWRGKSAFARELEQRGIRHVVAAPRHPRTLGKIERFWGSLWRECLETAIFLDLEDARRRIGLYIDHYNFARTHEGIGGLYPADRYFGAAPEVRKTMQARVAANALDLARNGVPKKPFYVTGQVGDAAFSVHAEGERMILTRGDGAREEIALVPPAAGPASHPGPTDAPRDTLPDPVCPQASLPEGVADEEGEPPPPGVSPLDEGLKRIRESLEPEGGTP